uniref:Uroplakin 3B n=1 Tax=Cyanistes caeruleus TaxID=156563 RepID=A0A8C0U7J9_CYACU
MGSVCSSPTLLATGRGLEFKPQLCVPGSCYPSNQSSELKRKLKQPCIEQEFPAEPGPRHLQQLLLSVNQLEPPSRLPYVPHLPPTALLGKVTATTFALERPRCVFDGHADAADAVWLAVAFANASAAFRNPLSRADVPRYKQLPTARSYMTLETAAAAYSCSAPSPPVLRVGADTACRDQASLDVGCGNPSLPGVPKPPAVHPPFLQTLVSAPLGLLLMSSPCSKLLCAAPRSWLLCPWPES